MRKENNGFIHHSGKSGIVSLNHIISEYLQWEMVKTVSATRENRKARKNFFTSKTGQGQRQTMIGGCHGFSLQSGLISTGVYRSIFP
jgi:hypothetical protein